MKLRVLITLLVIIGLVCGLVWWLQQPTEAAKEAVSSLVASPKSADTIENGSSSQSNPSKPEIVFVAPVTKNDPVAESSSNSGPTNLAQISKPNGSSLAGLSKKGLNFGVPSEEIRQFASTLLPSIGKRHNLTSLESLQLEGPLPIYDLYSTLAKGGSPSDAAFQNSYYYLVDDSGNAIDGFGAAARISSVVSTYPTSSYGLIKTGLQNLGGQEQVQAGSYEARLALFGDVTQAIWLKSATGDSDLYYVIRRVTSQPPIQAGTLLSAGDFLGVVGSIVQNRAAAVMSRGRATTGAASAGQ